MLENTIELLQARLEALDKYREDSAVAIDRLFGETSDLEESLEDLVPRIESLDQGEDGEGEEDGEEGEDEEEDDGEEEEDDGEETLEGSTPALPRSLGLLALAGMEPVETPIEAASLEATRTTLRQMIVSGLDIFPSARFYCTEPDCRFYDGTRKAWYNEDKAIEHEQLTGHDIGTVPE